MEGLFWEALSPSLSAFDGIRVRATAKEFKDAKKYGRHRALLLPAEHAM